MRYLIINIIVIFIFSACTLNTTKDLQIRNNGATIDLINTGLFTNSAIDYVYKSNIKAYGELFGGILVVKSLGDQHHRIAFMTEFGSTLFDFEFANEGFTVHSIIPQLDKKLLINLLKKDFQILLKNHCAIEKQYQGAEDTIVYQCHFQKAYNFYFYKKKQLKRIIHSSKYKEKLYIDFDSKNIQLKHLKIPLVINLKRI